VKERGRQHKQAPEREGECTLKNGKKTNCFQIENQILFFSSFISFCSLFVRKKNTKKKTKTENKEKETEQQQQNSINSTLILIRHLPVP